MADSSVLVQTRILDDFGDDDIANGRLFWQCESYDEYRLHCTIEVIKPLYTRAEFDKMKSGLSQIVSEIL